MQEELNGVEIIENDSENLEETSEIELVEQDSSESSTKNYEQATLTAMDTLNASSSYLLNIMEDSLKPLNEEGPVKEGIQRLEYTRAELAISAANAISKTIQTQVNMVKALKDIEF